MNSDPVLTSLILSLVFFSLTSCCLTAWIVVRLLMH